MKITPTGEALGAAITDIDLNAPMLPEVFRDIVRSVCEYGVLRFPDQLLGAPALKKFSERFGGLEVVPSHIVPHEPGVPEVMILSNIKEDGRPIGVPNAGQDWHTDMTYSKVVGFVNVLVAYAVPMREGKPLGGTDFVNTHAAYEGLPAAVKARLRDATATHVYGLFTERLAAKGRGRKVIEAKDRVGHPPVHHPVFLRHPITGRHVLYVNPGHVQSIDGMSAEESDATLAMLYEHALQPAYRYLHAWNVNDLVAWDNLGTWHMAVPDYGPEEFRHMKRCQVLADRVFDPRFLAESAPA